MRNINDYSNEQEIFIVDLSNSKRLRKITIGEYKEIFSETLNSLYRETPGFVKEPYFSTDKNEAIVELSDSLGKKPEVVTRYLACVEAAQMKKNDNISRYNKMREYIKLAAIEEAALLTIDSKLKEDVFQAKQKLEGEAKSQGMKDAFNSFLQRKNYGKICSDFWLVFRLVTKHVE